MKAALDLCHVLILAPLRNEVRSLPGLLASLLALDYPPPLLTIGLIDDGSTDGSGQLMDEFASAHPHVVVLHNSTSLGKANALNAGLRQWPQGDLVMVYDADARPQPDSLRQIVAAFDDPLVAGAGGLIRPRNGLATPSATYSAIERLVHQQVTLRAKDRLDLSAGDPWQPLRLPAQRSAGRRRLSRRRVLGGQPADRGLCPQRPPNAFLARCPRHRSRAGNAARLLAAARALGPWISRGGGKASADVRTDLRFLGRNRRSEEPEIEEPEAGIEERSPCGWSCGCLRWDTWIAWR